MATIGQMAAVRSRIVTLTQPAAADEPAWIVPIFEPQVVQLSAFLETATPQQLDVGRVIAALDNLLHTRLQLYHAWKFPQTGAAFAVANPHPSSNK
jgi:hypothetical protein